MSELQGYQLPDDLYYHKEHMWVKVEGNKATVGVTDFFVKLSGEISYIELPSTGDDLSKDDVVGTVETGKWIGKIYAPLTGTVESINEEIDDQPSLPNTDPYESGWLFKMTVSDPSEISSLFHGASAVEWQTEQIAKHIK
ncbi:MAG: glycine cleavage system protein GcvH [Caldisericia bacterium]|jgi:glycine cleavage system H protein|nr:glycine cleavage system protein GcvH [Caldisericia bacterium]